ncbi:hypothetical protein CV102_20745 [Natronococcus pandeyae]|uniref:Peptidase M10A and M12B matrixin and adamalysin n=1 Tax=Natronococcus pandeyae TaxID=2055836 RepID=A0A8J8Q0T2_9EURY|nr:hypothetical protein [Natronococcus pandeyae]TYL36709.1 hypothetical protein CV102_20745 [Natronococcus pandeyae]
MSRETQADSSTGSVRRRLFLGGLVSTLSIGSLGTLGYATRSPAETLEVRVWLSEEAARYDGVDDRLLEYLDALLGYEYWQLELSYGGVVSASTEDGARVTINGEWPRILAAGALGTRDLDPAADVNLLVTDGQMTTAPTGFALPHVASVGGARYLATLPPFDDLETVLDDGSIHRVVENERPTRTIQILLHELGHALGLEHDHGVAFRNGDAVVATPMLSSYAWDPSYDGDRSRCGTVYPSTDDRERTLSLIFSGCAQRELEEYNGGFSL